MVEDCDEDCCSELILETLLAIVPEILFAALDGKNRGGGGNEIIEGTNGGF
jgi:hypothetical protein